MARRCLCLTRTVNQLVESQFSSGNISQRCCKLALYCSYWCHYEQQLDDESGRSRAYKVPVATQIGLMTNISLQRPAGATLESLCTWDCGCVSKVSRALEAATNWGDDPLGHRQRKWREVKWFCHCSLLQIFPVLLGCVGSASPLCELLVFITCLCILLPGQALIKAFV